DYLEHLNAGTNIPYSGETDLEGNTYITGSGSNTNGPEGDFVTIKLNSDGDMEWEKRKPGETFSVEKGRVLKLDAEGNPIATGTSWNGNDVDMYTVKYDKNTGAVLWNATFDLGNSGLDIPKAMAVDQEGNVIIAGVA